MLFSRRALLRFSVTLLSSAAASAPVLSQSEMVIVKEGTKQYHRAGCPVIRDGKGVMAMTRAQAESRGYASHPDCDPALHPSNEDATDKPAQPAAPQYVYVDAAGKYYHRENCKRLGASPKKMLLDEAGKKYWPCSVCHPPIRKRPNDPIVPRYKG